MGVLGHLETASIRTSLLVMPTTLTSNHGEFLTSELLDDGDPGCGDSG